MSGFPISDQHERPPTPGWSMSKRFALAAVLIVAISAGATATVLSNRITTLAEEVFPKLNEINAPKGVVTPEYNGGPQTFLILGSDRRVGAKDAYDRENPPHSDTILLVRFDPEQGQTSVLSIPRDLMVNITASNGEVYSQEKINAAYTIGNKLGATRGGMVLAAETIEHEVFSGLKLNGIVDVSFAGFMKVVDTLGCAYVNVDHRYYNENNGTPETDYSNVNLQPGYQKLCYENALGYVRYRHDDSDFVRVARQQDFLRDLREQISPINELGQIDTVAKEVGHAISTTFHGSKEELIELAKLIAFSQGKPLRQVKFETSNDNFQQNKESFVLSTPELEQATLADFLHGEEQPNLPAGQSSKHSAHHGSHGSHGHSSGESAHVAGLERSSSGGASEALKTSIGVPFTFLYPTRQTTVAEQQQVRRYDLTDQQGRLHHAYVVVWRQNIGGYYDFEGTDWLNPPLFAHARVQRIDGRSYELIDDGSHIHVIGWRSGGGLYWLTNTLLEELSNPQMLALAKSAQPVH